MLSLQCRHHIRFVDDNDIVAHISLRPMSEVPFPSVTVSLGDVPDPMGYVKQSGNMVGLQGMPQKGLLLKELRPISIVSRDFCW